MSLLTNLVSYWKLDEASGATAIDANGSNNLSVTGSIGSGSGIINTARTNAGGGTNVNYLSIASNSTLQVTGDFTFSFWINPNDALNDHVILGKDGSTAGTHDYSIDISGTHVRLYFKRGAAGFVSSSVTLSNSTWYFCVCWYDSSGPNVNIQVNNGSVDTANVTDVPDVSSASFQIFSREATDIASNDWAGSIDEVGFWKRVLNSSERTQLYNSGAGYSYDNFAPPATEFAFMCNTLMRGPSTLNVGY